MLFYKKTKEIVVRDTDEWILNTRGGRVVFTIKNLNPKPILWDIGKLDRFIGGPTGL